MKNGFKRFTSMDDETRKWFAWVGWFYLGPSRRVRVFINLTFWRPFGQPIFELQKHA